jgi:CRISPR-associated Csx2 family protein
MTQESTPHVLVTTIGTGKYDPAKYAFPDQVVREGNLFPILLCDYLKQDGRPVQEAVVLLTEGAKSSPNWIGEQGLRSALAEKQIACLESIIPDGVKEDELWDIFDKIGENVPKGAKVVLDVTHGFRSLPLVMLLSCAYFKTSGQFELSNIYYGAFIPRPRVPTNPPTTQPVVDIATPDPVAYAVDLTPMLTLFAWANAVDVFKKSGDLRQMARLLEDRHKELFATRTVDTSSNLPLRPLGNQMKKLIDALELGRLESIAKPVQETRRLVDEVHGAAERWVKPFVSQIEAVLKALDQFQISMDEQNVHKWLIAQFELIEWYYQKNYYMQAGLLLREWIISYVASQEPEFADRSVQDIFNDKDVREAVTKKLNEVSRVGEEISEVSRLVAELGKKLNKMSGIVKDLNGIPHFEIHPNTASSFRGIWDEIVELRNDLAHLGHRKQSDTAQTIKSKIEGLIKRLRPLKESAEKASNSASQVS